MPFGTSVKRLVVVSVVVALSVAALQLPARAQTSTETSPTTASERFSGETVFRGLAFAQGPVAQLFPELAGRPAPSPESSKAIDLVIGKMSQLDPAFFDQFAADTQSGDRVRVRAALERANELGLRAIEELTADGGSPDRGVGIAQVLFFQAAVALLLAVAVLIVVAGEVFFFIDSTPDGSSPLARDRWADRIAVTLR